MNVNSVTFRFTEVGKIRDLEKILDGNILDAGSGTRLFIQGGQLAIQLFGPSLSTPTPEQKDEFENVLSLLKNLGNALAQEEIK